MTGFSTEKRVQIVGSLVVANSIRAIVRMTGAAKNRARSCLWISAQRASSTSG